MATITDFIARVRIQIRDNGTQQAFADSELTQFIQDSVMEYSKYLPLRKSFVLNLVAGQTTYQLPTDWIRKDEASFQKAIQPTPLPSPLAYALPFVYVNEPLGVQVDTMTFDWYDDQQQLVLGTAPFQVYTLTFDYYAYHTVDDTGTTIPAHMQYYALLPAYKKALRALATDDGAKLQKYRVGGRYGVEVDNTQIAKLLQAEADAFDKEFLREIVQRPYGTHGGEDRWLSGITDSVLLE